MSSKRLRRIERTKDLSDSQAQRKIAVWMTYFKLSDWVVETERVDPKQIDYNGEKYFIAIDRNFKTKTAVINHDIDLCEESIVHELLHIVYPKEQQGETYAEYEEWIDLAAKEYCENLPLHLV